MSILNVFQPSAQRECGRCFRSQSDLERRLHNWPRSSSQEYVPLSCHSTTYLSLYSWSSRSDLPWVIIRSVLALEPNLISCRILTVGPIISLNALAKASLGITADFNLTTTFDLPQVDLVFPPSAGQSAATVIPRETRPSVPI